MYNSFGQNDLTCQQWESKYDLLANSCSIFFAPTFDVLETLFSGCTIRLSRNHISHLIKDKSIMVYNY